MFYFNERSQTAALVCSFILLHQTVGWIWSLICFPRICPSHRTMLSACECVCCCSLPGSPQLSGSAAVMRFVRSDAAPVFQECFMTQISSHTAFCFIEVSAKTLMVTSQLQSQTKSKWCQLCTRKVEIKPTAWFGFKTHLSLQPFICIYIFFLEPQHFKNNFNRFF